MVIHRISLGLLLPAPVVKAIQLGSGTKVEIEVSEDSIVKNTQPETDGESPQEMKRGEVRIHS